MIKKILFVFLGLIPVFGSYAQQNMTLYQMHDILQSNSLNPSVASDCRWNIGFPLLGNISVAAGMPVAYNDLTVKNAAANTTANETQYYATNNSRVMSGDELLSLLKNNNLFSANVNVNILTIGYRSANTYYQFTMNDRVSLALSVNKEPFELLFKGNAPFAGQMVEGKFAASGMFYREYGMNIAHDFGDNFWFGARAKLLFGRLSVYGPHNIASFYTDPSTYTLTLNSDLLVRGSVPGTMKTDAKGFVTGFDSNIAIGDLVLNTGNIGGAIDLGFNKTLENGVKISGSILNLGIVNWNKNTHALNRRASLNYTGPTPAIDSWKDLVDTLKSVVKFSYTKDEAYSQWLSPEIMFGFSAPVADYLRLGVTGYGAFNPAGFPWALTATALTDNISNFYGAVSYTVTNNSFVNVGLGLGVKLGAFNLHVITDNIIATFNPLSQKYATVQFGINFKFGCGENDDSSGKKMGAVPCPSYGGSKSSGAIPCPSSSRRSKR
ncbi:MAG: DUF5723 family protein [Prevotellaceae bacterium]|jgi:hypothetical protein|nr:DUF5723 family protein [Prevotellaceae bacterium]